jgi:hypothetical protein
MQNILLRVTQTHIDNAKIGSYTCPLALAGQEQFNNKEISVGTEADGRYVLMIENNDGCVDFYLVSKAGSNRIRNWDYNKNMKPSRFLLTRK